MKLLFDLVPALFFFLVYMGGKALPDSAATLASGLLGSISGEVPADKAPFLLATAVMIVVTVVQVGWSLAAGRKVGKMLLISLALVIVFGGATLWLRDPTFIKWKASVLYWLFAVVFLGSDLLLGKNLVRAMMEKQLGLPDVVWRRLNLSWVAFFMLLGFLNLYVAYRFSESAWVNFKLFGVIGLMILFVFAQSLLLSRHLQKEEGK